MKTMKKTGNAGKTEQEMENAYKEIIRKMEIRKNEITEKCRKTII